MSNAGTQKEEEVRAKVSGIVSHPEYRDEIVQFVKDNGGLEYAVSRLDAYVEAAVGALKMFPESEARDSLMELAYFTADRAM